MGRGRGDTVDDGVHETAVVDAGAEIGVGTRVWHFCHISTGAQIGRHCSFGQNCFVDRGVKIGHNVRVQNNVSIYRGVHVADHVFLGPSCVLTNVLTPRSAFPRQDPARDHAETWIELGASIGANATIRCGVRLGAWSLVGSGAVVTHDVPPHAVVVGVPARQVGWACRCGGQLRDDRSQSVGPRFSCPEPDCGRSYRLDGEHLVLASCPAGARQPLSLA